MRETRLSGSEGGGAGKTALPTPIGSGNNNAENGTAANRNGNEPANRDNILSFRLARAARPKRRFRRTEPAALPFRWDLGRGGRNASEAAPCW